MSTTLTITEAGQVTLDRELLDHLGVKPGERLAVALDPRGKVSLSAAPNEAGPGIKRSSGRIEDTFGMLNKYYDGPPLTDDQINEAISNAWAGKR